MFDSLVIEQKFLSASRPRRAAEPRSHDGLSESRTLHYCSIGIAISAFSLAPEYKLVTGKDPFARSHIEQIAALVCDFLFARSTKSCPWRSSVFRLTSFTVLLLPIGRQLASFRRKKGIPGRFQSRAFSLNGSELHIG
jgi:hypothetical protein